MASYDKFIEDMNVKELKAALRSVGCEILSGKKRTLRDRLMAVFVNGNEDKVLFRFKSGSVSSELKAEIIANGGAEGNREENSDVEDCEGLNPGKCDENLRDEVIKLQSRVKLLTDKLQKINLDKECDGIMSTGKPEYGMLSVLHFNELKGIAAHGKLSNWCKEVELFCGASDRSRVKGAFAKMDHFTKSALISSDDLDLDTCSWDQVKNHLKTKLLPKQTFHTAWLEMTNHRYDSSRPPREYFIEIMNLHSSIKQVFGDVPDLYNTVKVLLARDFPKELSNYMETFLDSKIPFDRFLEKLEIHWASLQRPPMHKAYINVVKPAENENFAKGKVNGKKVKHGRKWCHVCYKSSHYTNDCNYKPPAGTCWACKKEGHVMNSCPEYQFFREQSQKLCYDLYSKLGKRQFDS